MEYYNTEIELGNEKLTKYNTNDKSAWITNDIHGPYISGNNNKRSEAFTPYKPISIEQIESTNKPRSILDSNYNQLDKSSLYEERSRYSFEPAHLDKTTKVKSERNSIEKTLDHWIKTAKLTVALPVVSAAGLDLITRDRKLTFTRKVIGTYGKTIKWSILNSPKAYNKAKSLAARIKK